MGTVSSVLAQHTTQGTTHFIHTGKGEALYEANRAAPTAWLMALQTPLPSCILHHELLEATARVVGWSESAEETALSHAGGKKSPSIG